MQETNFSFTQLVLQQLKSSLWDVGLRFDGLFALKLRDPIVSVLGNVSRVQIDLTRKSMR